MTEEQTLKDTAQVESNTIQPTPPETKDANMIDTTSKQNPE